MAGSLYEAVGSDLRARRTARGMKQEDLALQIGLSRASVANMEAGRQTMSLHLLAELASALGTTSSSVLRAVEDKHVQPERPSADLPPAVQAFIRNKVALRS